MCASPCPRRRDENSRTGLGRGWPASPPGGWWPLQLPSGIWLGCEGQRAWPSAARPVPQAAGGGPPGKVGRGRSGGGHTDRPERRGLVLTTGRAGHAPVHPCPEPSSPHASGTGRTRLWGHCAPTACRSPRLCPASVRTRLLAKLLFRVVSDAEFVPPREPSVPCVNLFPLPAAPARKKYHVRRTDDAVLSSAQCRDGTVVPTAPQGLPACSRPHGSLTGSRACWWGPGAEPFGVFLERRPAGAMSVFRSLFQAHAGLTVRRPPSPEERACRPGPPPTAETGPRAPVCCAGSAALLSAGWRVSGVGGPGGGRCVDRPHPFSVSPFVSRNNLLDVALMVHKEDISI